MEDGLGRSRKIDLRLSFSSWQGEDMVLLDSCLVDEDQEACVAFMDAMGRLRELHEGSPGNA